MSTQAKFLADCTYQEALDAQSQAYSGLGSESGLIGFEVSKPVVTLGLSAKPEIEIVDSSIDWIRVDRGGKATLHSPGQLVLFPVWRLSSQELGVRERACQFLKALSGVLESSYGVQSRLEDGSGLFTTGGKMAFSGFRVRDKKVYHGFALNVSNDLSQFAGIRSCGAGDRQHDGLQKHTDKPLDPAIVFSEISQQLLFA